MMNSKTKEAINEFIVEVLEDSDAKKNPEMVSAIAGLINALTTL